jgi:FkbM family methyltransferase
MLLGKLKERLIETSSIARIIYGLKLLLLSGLNDESKWFLLNKENLKYKVKLKSNGLVLDFGGYVGEFTSKMSKLNPDMLFLIFEPIPNFYKKCQRRFRKNRNVSILPYGVTSNGRNIDLAIDGPRTRTNQSGKNLGFPSKSITGILDNLDQVELLKMNIEGLEYECLLSIIENGSIKKINYLLVQFHNFNVDDENSYIEITSLISEDFIRVFSYKWKWELWRIKNYE